MKTNNNYFGILREKYQTTDGSIDAFHKALSALIVSSYLDKDEVKRHNELLLPGSPDYVDRSFEDIRLLEIASDILRAGKFESFSDLSSFMAFLGDSNYLNEIESCSRSIGLSNKVLSAEGTKSTDFDTLSQFMIRTVLEDLGTNLNPNTSTKLFKELPSSFYLYDGTTTSKLINSVREIKNASYLGLREDIGVSYKDFDLTILDFYRDNDALGEFCETVRQFNSAFKEKRKKQ